MRSVKGIRHPWLVSLSLVCLASCTPQEKSRPADFAILLETGGNRIDTFEGQVTKDLVLAGDTTIALRLTPAELDTLHYYVRLLEILDLPEPHPPIEATGFIVPSFRNRLRVRSGGRQREFLWESGWRPGSGSAYEQWQRLFRMIAISRRVVEERPEYRDLPAPTGGYW